MSPTDPQTSPTSLLQSLLTLVLNDPTKTLALLTRIGEYVQSRFQREGLYEVLEHDVRLKIHDIAGQRATYFKRQKVRFRQNNVIAYQDQAWGDGDIFADYKCSLGVPVDRYREGHRYRILISLRQTKNRGDEELFQIERHIRNGFTKREEYLQTEVDHQTRKLSLSVTFPAKRKPDEVLLTELHRERTTQLGADRTRRLPNGDWLVCWQTSAPKYLENYILRWKW